MKEGVRRIIEFAEHMQTQSPESIRQEIDFHLLSDRPHFITVMRELIRIYDNDCNSDMRTNGEFGVLKVLLSKFNKPDSVYFDCGANQGNYAQEIVRGGFQGKLVLIDPIQGNLAEASRKISTVESHPALRVIYRCCAVSDVAGFSKFFERTDPRASGESSLGDINNIGYSFAYRPVEVPLQTLDGIVEDLNIDQADFIQLDIEGAEYKVLCGSKGLLDQQRVKFCQFEFGHAARAFRVYLYDFYKLLESYVYEIFVIKPDRLEKLGYSPFVENRWSYVDFLAKRNDIKL